MIRQFCARKVGAAWGVVGVIGLLGFAIVRLAPFVSELFGASLSIWHYGALVLWGAFMVYSEGYKAFGQRFAPRVVARARYLSKHATWRRAILAPLFCAGYFGTTRKNSVIAIALIVGIIILIVAVHFVPQPWRGIIDVGVILGLVCGIWCLLLESCRALTNTTYAIDPEVV